MIGNGLGEKVFGATVVLSSLVLGLLLLVGGVSGASVSSCTLINSSGVYVLTADITDSAATKCIEITASDVVFDGGGYTVDGQDTSFTKGVYVYNSSTALTNVTVKNLIVTDWRDGIYYQDVQNGSVINSTWSSNARYGIYLDSSSNNTIANNTASENNKDGIVMENSHNNSLIGNHFQANGNEGVSLWDSSNIELIDNTVTLNYRHGIWFHSSNNNTLTSNNVSSNTEYGIYFDYSSNNNFINNTVVSNAGSGIYILTSSGNTIYNNYFNNTANYGFGGTIYTNNWNTTEQAGTNVNGGPNMGGNYWVKPDGTGFSNTCSDLDGDGICDSPLSLASGNVDYLPIPKVVGQDLSAPYVTNVQYNLTGVIDSTTAFHVNVTVTDAPSGVDTVWVGNTINLTMANMSGGVYGINTTPQALGCTTSGACVITFYANDTVGNVNNTLTLSITLLEYQPGWPINLGKTITSVTVADIDSNESNGLEILLGSGITYPTASGKVWAYHGDNTTVSGWPKSLTSSGEVLNSLPAVGDLLNTGVPVVVVASTAGRVYAWYGNGTSLWTVSIGSSTSSTPLIADIDGDLTNGREIVVGADDSKVHIFYSNGTRLRTLSAGEKLTSSPSVGDIDGDGDLEIIIGSYDYNVYAWHHDGVSVTGWPKPTGNFVTSSPTLCDLDGDGLLDVVVGSEDRKIYAFKGDGTNLAGAWPVSTGGQITTSPACGDINGDGTNEIAVGSYDNKIYVLYENGTVMWKKDVGAPVISSPALGDIDGDSDIEIIVGTWSTNLIALHNNGSYVAGWPVTGDGDFLGSPAIADIDSDNKTEIVATTSVGSIYVWGMNTQYNESYVPWAMFGKNPSHTGSASPHVDIISPPAVGFKWVNEDSAFFLNISEAVFPSGSPVVFNGSAYDPTTTISSYRWSSSLGGSLGTGRNISISSLTRGSHEINLSATTATGGRGFGFTRVFVYTGSVTFSDDTPLFDIDPTTGVISFTPNNSQVGNYTINVTMTDDTGYLGSVVFGLRIFNTNDAPQINTTSPFTFINEDNTSYYDFNASDDDLDAGYGDSLIWSVNNSNMSINPLTGALQWSPDRWWAGVNHTIDVTVTDSSGAQDSLVYNVYVNRTSSLLVVTVQKDRGNYYQNDNVTLKAYLYDFYGGNLTANTVTAVMEKPCGGKDNVTMSYMSDNIYQGTYAGTFIPGQYTATIYADEPGFQTGIINLTFQVSSPVSWAHYLNATVGSASNRTDAPVELDLNFTQILKTLGLPGQAFDNNSIRIIETNSLGRPIKEVPYQFDKYVGDPNSTNIANLRYQEIGDASIWGGPSGYYDCSSISNPEPKGAVDGGDTTNRWGGCICRPGDDCYNTFGKFLPAGMGLDLGSQIYLRKVFIETWKPGEDKYYPKKYTLSISDDNITYTTILNETNGGSSDKETQYFEFVSGRYLWLNVTQTFDNQGKVSVEEIEVYKYDNVYNATTNAHGNLTWVMDGDTTTGADRYYQIRFGTVEEGAKISPAHNIDYSGYNHTSGLSVTVYNASNNTAPIINFTGNNTPFRNVIDTFNATNSSDPDADYLYYYWNFGECQGGVGETIDYGFTIPGTKNVTLTIWDTKGGFNQTNMTVTVSNSPPVLDPIGYLNAKEDFPFYYDVNASDIDNASEFDTFTYSSNSTIFIINSSTGIISFIPNRSTVGNHTINITVSDGYFTDYEVIPFRVNLTYHVPNLTFIESKTAVENQTLLFYVNATDIDLDYGDNLTFTSTCTFNGTYEGTCNVSLNIIKVDNDTARIDVTPVNVTEFGTREPHIASGLHWINLTVSDAQNLKASQMFPLTVLSSSNSPPVIVNYTLPYNINESEDLNLFVNVTDPDTGTVPTIYLYRNGTLVNYSITNVMNYTWATNYADAGEFKYEVVVTDGINRTTLYYYYNVWNVNRAPEIIVTSFTNNLTENHSRVLAFDETIIRFRATDLDNETLNLSYQIDDGSKLPYTLYAPYNTLANPPPKNWSETEYGTHTINLTASDPFTTTNYLIQVDVVPELIPPVITIQSPHSTTFSTPSIPLNVYADETIDTWMYSLDGNPYVTFTPNTTLSPGSGNHTLVVWANDSYDNYATKTVKFSVVPHGTAVLTVNDVYGAVSGAAVTNDGVLVGNTDSSGKISIYANASTHTITILSGKYLASDGKSYVYAGNSSSVTITAGTTSFTTLTLNSLDISVVDEKAKTIDNESVAQYNLLIWNRGSQTTTFTLANISNSSALVNFSNASFSLANKTKKYVTLNVSSGIPGYFVTMINASSTALGVEKLINVTTGVYMQNITFIAVTVTNDSTSIFTEATILGDSEVNDSNVSSSVVVDTSLEDSIIDESTLTNADANNATITNSSVESATVNESTVTDGAVITSSNVTNGSTVSGSTVTNGSEIIGSNVTSGSEINDAQIVNNALISGSTVDNSTVNNSQVTNSSIDDITLQGATVTDNVLQSGSAVVISQGIQFNDTEENINISDLVVSINSTTTNLINGNTTTISDPTNTLKIDINSNSSGSADIILAITGLNPAGPPLDYKQYIYIESNTTLNSSTVNEIYIEFYYNENSSFVRSIGEENLIIQYFNDSTSPGTWEDAAPEGKRGVNTSENRIWTYVYHASVFGLGGTVSQDTTPTSVEGEITPGVTIAPGEAKVTTGHLMPGDTEAFHIPESQDIYITELEITASKFLTGMVTVTTLPDKPSTLLPGPGIVFKYIEVSPYLIKEDEVGKVGFTFKVEKAWFDGREVDPETIALYRFTTSWEKLDTTRVEDDEAYVFYKAVSPGLSYFAISGEKRITSRDEVPDEIIPVVPPMTTSPPEETSTPPILETTPEQPSVLSRFWLGIAVAVVLAMAAVYYRFMR